MSTRSQTMEPSGPDDVLVVGRFANGAVHLWYWCPVCHTHHCLPQKGTPSAEGYEAHPQWEWNGDKVKPSLMPSVLSTGYAAGKAGGICHHYVTKGEILYLGDTTHELAGKHVAMERPPVARDIEEKTTDGWRRAHL